MSDEQISAQTALIEELAERAGNQLPWNRHDWTGKFYSFDETSTADFGPEDVAEIIDAGNSGRDQWDGDAFAIIKLKDGRYVAWESTWGPTGDGFCCDAYGGNANVYFAKTAQDAAKFGLSQEWRDKLKL